MRRRSSVLKALGILGLFDLEHPELGVRAIARSLEMPVGSVHRLLADLCAEGCVIKTPQGSYRLGLKAVEIGALALHHLGFGGAIQPSLEEVVEKTHETASVAVLDGEEIVYMAVLESKSVLRSHVTVGSRVVATGTALGRALIAFTVDRADWPPDLTQELATVRSTKVAYDLEEFALSVHCVSVPILDNRDMALAALSISGPSSRMTDAHMRQAIPVLRSAASSIARALLHDAAVERWLVSVSKRSDKATD